MPRLRRILPPKPSGRLQPTPTELTRFLRRLQTDGECWVWTGHTDRLGYGQFKFRRRAVWVHRWAYLVFRAALREGDHVDHRCGRPSCVNPWHLVRKPMGEHLSESAKRRHEPEPPF